ncbi:hypothetical protein QE152_g29260 [Popillia japonica]|uniref:Uncharacterized protein n=1 Tax=Popillia japonica TaxID=7064 RepID=A0AAW1JI79_POPJA
MHSHFSNSASCPVGGALRPERLNIARPVSLFLEHNRSGEKRPSHLRARESSKVDPLRLANPLNRNFSMESNKFTRSTCVVEEARLELFRRCVQRRS